MRNNTGNTRTEDREPFVAGEETKVEAPGYAAVIGLDLGDRESCYCVLDPVGEVVGTGTLRTNEKQLRLFFERQERLRVAMEVGTHSRWASRLLAELGHAVIGANPLRTCSYAVFASKLKQECPEPLRVALLPLARMVDQLTKEIRLYDQLVRKKARQEYPETKVIQTIYVVGPLVLPLWSV
jgi:hypothetical protein